MPTSLAEPTHRSTGPKTEAGKRISSRNATTHGCCSSKLFLPGDNPADYQRLLDQWTAAYASEPHPEDFVRDALIELLATNHWLLLRSENRYLAIEQHLHRKDLLQWTEDEQKKLDRLLRYKTAAERSFYRSFNALEKLRNDHVRHEFTRERIDLARRRMENAAAFKPAAVPPKPPPHASPTTVFPVPPATALPHAGSTSTWETRTDSP